MEKPGITFTLFIFLLVLIVLVIIHPHSQQNKIVAKKITKHIVVTVRPIAIITPEQNILMIGSSTSATFRTYTSTQGGYSITYPSVWTPAIQQQLQNFTGDIPVLTTGPIGNKVLGYPSFLQVAVDNDTQGLSLQSFIKHEYGAIQLTPVTIGGVQGSETNDIQGLAPNITMWVEHSQKIYQIRFFNGAQPKITDEQLSKILASFAFH